MKYSQNDEQNVILKYFGSHKGAFLDIGANDGVTLSNTYALFKLGWHGVCVEASPAAFGRLLTTYAGVNPQNILCLNYAIGGYDGEILLHESGELLGKGDVALVSSTKTEETKRWTSLNMPFKDVLVPMWSFKTLLKKLKRTFDFISLDIEGMELEVLPQIDLKLLGTKLICVEFNGKEKEKYDRIIIRQGFKLIHKNAENLIYSI